MLYDRLVICFWVSFWVWLFIFERMYWHKKSKMLTDTYRGSDTLDFTMVVGWRGRVGGKRNINLLKLKYAGYIFT